MLAPVKGGELYTKFSSQNNIVVKYYIWHIKPQWQVTWESIRHIAEFLLACTKKRCQIVLSVLSCLQTGRQAKSELPYRSVKADSSLCRAIQPGNS